MSGNEASDYNESFESEKKKEDELTSNHQSKKQKLCVDQDVTKSTQTESTNSNGKEACDLITPLIKAGITHEDIQTTVRVLNSIASLKTIRRPKQVRKRKAQQKQNSDENESAYSQPQIQEEETQKEQDGLSYYQHSSLRSIRKPLGQIYEHLHKKILYNGLSEQQHYEQLIAERTLKRQKMAESSRQQQYLNSATLRKQRLSNLEKLKSDADSLVVKEEQEKLNRVLNLMIPDGAVETTEDGTPTSASPALLTNGDKATSDSSSKEESEKESNSKSNPTVLPKLRSCYVCKVHFRILHHFYDQLCPSCAALNFKKRHTTVDLTKNYVAVVTGARIKIGFQTVLKLLRAGATVIATTRFPNSAIQAYLKEKDHKVWNTRLHLYGLDLRDVIGIEAFVAFVAKKYGKVDIIVNNACQTVRRPVGYYRPVVEEEMRLWNEFKDKSMEEGKMFLTGCREFEEFRRKKGLSNVGGTDGSNMLLNGGGNKQTKIEQIQNGEKMDVIDAEKNSSNDEIMVVSSSSSKNDEIVDVSQKHIPDYESTGICHSAMMSQTILLPDDANPLSSTATAVKDVNNQALDIRRTNSWILKLEQISTPEILEAIIINAVAPFILNSRLIPLMMPPTDQNGDATNDTWSSQRHKFIINVSAMEGKFYRYKMPNHPHTNMAKAALNMMTRTSSEELATKYNIYMNSVDTGWINDENPLERASKTAKTNHFQTPIDEIDAAARILDPIFSALVNENDSDEKQKKPEYGKFFKDYRESEW